VQSPGVRQIAAVTGVYGLSFLAVATSALLAGVLLSPRRARAGLALAGWLALLLLAQVKLAPPPATVGKELAILVQPNVPLEDAELDGWIPWRDPTQLQQLVQFSVNAVEQFSDTARNEPAPGAPGPAHPPLLIWAENPAPFFFTRDPIFRNAMENMARQTHAFVIMNTIIPVDARGEEITNSAITLDPEGREVSRYDKIHLVPFGEYVPGWALPGLVHKITSEVGNFVPGSSYPVAKSPGGGIGVMICYEAIIPQLARQLVAGGAGVLVNISNDAWYGHSSAAYQHLEMARLRAIENHRYLLRATNNGLTTLIDPYGRVREEIPRRQRMVMPAHFDFETRQTFYSAHGDVFAWLCAVAAGLMLRLGSLTKKRGVIS
jgi:apolipoprotein N-acyltransferase